MHLARSTLLLVGKVNGGSLALLTDPASGDITVERPSLLDARGGSGNGGTLTISAPAGIVSIANRVTLTGVGGGHVQADAVSLAIGPAVRIDSDGKSGGPPAEMRLSQSGAGLMVVDGLLDARADGTIEALAPAGDLTVSGRFRVGPAGCIGLSAGGTLTTTGGVFDVPLTASCP